MYKNHNTSIESYITSIHLLKHHQFNNKASIVKKCDHYYQFVAS